MSRIFLPNDKALSEENKKVYEMFGLNSRQISIIAQAVPKREYYYTSPLGARLYNLALGPIALDFVAVDKKDLIACQKIIDAYGHKDFYKHWLDYKREQHDAMRAVSAVDYSRLA